MPVEPSSTSTSPAALASPPSCPSSSTSFFSPRPAISHFHSFLLLVPMPTPLVLHVPLLPLHPLPSSMPSHSSSALLLSRVRLYSLSPLFPSVVSWSPFPSPASSVLDSLLRLFRCACLPAAASAPSPSPAPRPGGAPCMDANISQRALIRARARVRGRCPRAPPKRSASVSYQILGDRSSNSVDELEEQRRTVGG